MPTAIIFIATFVISALVNMQARNSVYGHYFALFITSILIGTINLYLLTTIPHIGNIIDGMAYVIGGASGAVTGVIMHKRFNK